MTPTSRRLAGPSATETATFDWVHHRLLRALEVVDAMRTRPREQGAQRRRELEQLLIQVTGALEMESRDDVIPLPDAGRHPGLGGAKQRRESATPRDELPPNGGWFG